MYTNLFNSSVINWKSGKNLCVEQRRAFRKFSRGKPIKSFFNFFEINDNSYDEEADCHLGVVLKDTLVPSAVLWFTGEACDHSGEFEEDNVPEEVEKEDDG
jgi:hypothetical protein